MKYFKLPDLGEGLQEAEIVTWHIKVGDHVALDQLLVSVETAKAIVELPSPQAGEIAELFGQEGDLIHIGDPLLEYANEQATDTGTVVGEVQQSSDSEDITDKPDDFIIGSAHQANTANVLTTPAVRALAKKLGLNLDRIKGTGKQGMITAVDVEKAAALKQSHGDSEPIRGVRRVMAKNMAAADAQVVRVTIQDEANIASWHGREDITLRLIQAMAHACKQEPIMNSWYDGEQQTLRQIDQVDLGIAVDTPDGLFVPVLRNIGARASRDLKLGLESLRKDVRARTIPPQELSGATITLSNYGTIAGRFGNPVVMPPTVAILGAGRIFETVIPSSGELKVCPVLPLSLSFDHRAITGGEAARFLGALLESLALPESETAIK